MKKRGSVLIFLLSALSICIFTFPLPAAPEKITPSGKEYLKALSDAFVEATEKVKPAVVSIVSVKKVRYAVPEFNFPFPDDFFEPFGDDFLRRFFQFRFPQLEPREFMKQGIGSGVIVDGKKGYILTNNHVIADADEINVMLPDKRTFTGKVKGRDPKTDIALVQIEGEDLPEAQLGDSDTLRVGDWVLAIGNPFGLSFSVTAGIISAKGRTVGITGAYGYEDFIQTDAAINPGNSGGPLIDLEGKVVGINTAIASATGGYQGVGFAIPINMAKVVMEELETKGKVVRGWLGVVIQNLTPELSKKFNAPSLKGALVSQVNPKTPAEKAGIKTGDIIVEIDGKEVADTTELRNTVARLKPGKEVEVVVLRDGKRKTLTVTIGEQPEEIAEAGQPEKAEESEEKFGIRVTEITPDVIRRFGLSKDITGVLVIEVKANSPAAKEDIKPGDVIVEVNRQPVNNLKEYNKEMAKAAQEGSVLLLIKTKEGSRFVALKSK